MARRKKTSPLEDLLDVFSLLPWWIGVAVAIVSYFVLHRIAGESVTPMTQLNQMGTMVTQTLLHTAATVGQYALPIIACAGAAMSAWRRHQRRSLLTNVATSQAPYVLDGLSWREFEILIGEAFRLQGYQVAENSGGADGGIDLTLRKDGETYLVQCKQWKAYKVGVPVVRELYGVMAAKGAAGGFVVTSGRFTDEATAFADSRNLTLIDGPALQVLIKRAQAARSGQPPTLPINPMTPPVTGINATPSCPVCNQSMVWRTAKRGPNAGNAFWGCSSYPRCKGLRPV